MNGIYKFINAIILKNETDKFECDTCINFNEFDNKIIFETPIPIEEIKRGWVGDLIGANNGAIYDSTGELINEHIYCASFKDVLLARINICSEPKSTIVWKYTFLKD